MWVSGQIFRYVGLLWKAKCYIWSLTQLVMQRETAGGSKLWIKLADGKILSEVYKMPLRRKKYE